MINVQPLCSVNVQRWAEKNRIRLAQHVCLTLSIVFQKRMPSILAFASVLPLCVDYQSYLGLRVCISIKQYKAIQLDALHLWNSKFTANTIMEQQWMASLLCCKWITGAIFYFNKVNRAPSIRFRQYYYNHNNLRYLPEYKNWLCWCVCVYVCVWDIKHNIQLWFSWLKFSIDILLRNILWHKHDWWKDRNHAFRRILLMPFCLDNGKIDASKSINSILAV